MKYLNVIVTIALGLMLFSCQNAGKKSEPMTMEAYKQVMEDYHSIMAASYHPALGGDIEPAKLRHERLLESAQEWAGKDIPDELDAEKISGLLEQLIKRSESFSNAVTGEAGDEEVEKKLKELHDIFHQLNQELTDDEEEEEAGAEASEENKEEEEEEKAAKQ